MFTSLLHHKTNRWICIKKKKKGRKKKSNLQPRWAVKAKDGRFYGDASAVSEIPQSEQVDCNKENISAI